MFTRQRTWISVGLITDGRQGGSRRAESDQAPLAISLAFHCNRFFAVGLPLGAVSGSSGGWADLLLQRVTDILLSFPGFLLRSPWWPSSILIAAGLGFLGLGVQSSTPEWGAMLGEARNYIFTDGNLATLPGLAIFLAVLAFNLLGDGLRDALDPRLA